MEEQGQKKWKRKKYKRRGQRQKKKSVGYLSSTEKSMHVVYEYMQTSIGTTYT